jgi:hypothetical protein
MHPSTRCPMIIASTCGDLVSCFAFPLFTVSAICISDVCFLVLRVLTLYRSSSLREGHLATNCPNVIFAVCFPKSVIREYSDCPLLKIRSLTPILRLGRLMTGSAGCFFFVHLVMCEDSGKSNSKFGLSRLVIITSGMDSITFAFAHSSKFTFATIAEGGPVLLVLGEGLPLSWSGQSFAMCPFLWQLWQVMNWTDLLY